MFDIFGYAFLVVIVGIIVFSTFFTVEQQSVALIERFGAYRRTAHAGLSMKVPFIDHIAKRISLKIQQQIVEVETKTKDDVFVKLPVAVQFHVAPGQEADSYYKLQDHDEQIESYVLDVVRAKVPTMDLNDVFAKKDDIGQNVKEQLGAQMGVYGFIIANALVRDVVPDEGVKQAMNEKQRQQRLREAAEQQGEAAKILAVKSAEAEKETKRLQGEGVAAERIAIAEGIKKSTDLLIEASGGNVDPKEAMNTLLMTQYFDTMKAIGTSKNASTVFLPYSPGSMSDLRSQIAEGVMAGKQVPESPRPAVEGPASLPNHRAAA